MLKCTVNPKKVYAMFTVLPKEIRDLESILMDCKKEKVSLVE